MHYPNGRKKYINPKCGLFGNSHKTDRSKQSPNGQKFALERRKREEVTLFLFGLWEKRSDWNNVFVMIFGIIFV
jgi:hypothetical protein